MGRRERKKMQSRRMILEAAVSEFSKNGYKDTSVADIMRTADLGIGTFYNYFTSKEDLLFSLLSRLGDAIRMALTEARAADRTALELLEVGARVTAKFLDENRFVMPLFLAASRHAGPQDTETGGHGGAETADAPHPHHGGHPGGGRMTPQIKQIFTEIIAQGRGRFAAMYLWISSRRCSTRSIRRRRLAGSISRFKKISRSRQSSCSTASGRAMRHNLVLCIVF